MMYYLKDGSDDGQTYDEFEVREMLYGDQYASGGDTMLLIWVAVCYHKVWKWITDKVE